MHDEISNGTPLAPVKAIAIVSKAAKHTPRTFNLPTIQQYINIAFETQLQIFHKSGIELKIGDPVLARMRGFDPWAARIVGFSNNKKTIKCYFFGTHNSGNVGSKSVLPFMNASDIIRLISLRNTPNFIKGINEIEIEFGIPRELSCLTECNAIE